MIFPITYILLLVLTTLNAYQKHRGGKRTKKVEQTVEAVPVVKAEHEPLPACFTIEWDLENGGSKITVDE